MTTEPTSIEDIQAELRTTEDEDRKRYLQSRLEEVLDQVVDDAISDYSSKQAPDDEGRVKIPVGAVMGLVMKATQGKAPAALAQSIVIEKLRDDATS